MKKSTNKKKGRNCYYETLSKVGKKIDDTLIHYLNDDEFGEYKHIIYEPFLKRKWGKQKLRGTLTYLAYCALINSNPCDDLVDKNLLRLMSAIELELWSEYMVNWIFDNKGEVMDKSLHRKKAAVSSKSFLEDAVKISSMVGEKYSNLVLETSGHVTNSFTKEFIMDMSNKDILTGNIHDYLDLYRRDYAIPGIGRTYSLGVDFAMHYTHKDDCEKAKKLHKIFLQWGVESETLNDLGDFCLTGTSTDKVSQDQFSDIRNGALRPPIWLMYNSSNDEDKQFMISCINKKKLSSDEEKKLVQILFETGTYDTISRSLKKSGRILKKAIKNLKFNNEGSKQLQQAVSVLESNKIYHSLKESYEEKTNQKWCSNQKVQNENHALYTQYIINSYKDLNL